VVSSLLLALAPDGTTLIALRALQGISAAMLYATQAAIVTSVYPPQHRGRALGMVASAVYFGLTVGPLVGGWLVEHFGWRVAFVVHVPLTLGVLLFALPRVQGDWSAPTRGRFDWRGALAYAGGILCVIVGASSLHASAGPSVLLSGVLLLLLFIRSQRRHEYPLFDVSLFFTNRVFALSSLAALLMYTTTFSAFAVSERARADAGGVGDVCAAAGRGADVAGGRAPVRSPGAARAGDPRRGDYGTWSRHARGR
jgi:MFS family permease